jgi:Uma2 family endonuclease
MVANPRVRFLAEDIWEIPDPPEDRYQRYEVLDGQLFASPTPLRVHQHVLGNVAGTVRELINQHELGEVIFGPIGVMLGKYDAVQPDLVFVSNERRDILSPRAVEGVPDLIVEIAELATDDRDRGIKRERYAAHRVPHYWIADVLAQTIEEYVLGEDGYGPPTVYRVGDTFQPSLFPGLAIEVARLWP